MYFFFVSLLFFLRVHSNNLQSTCIDFSRLVTRRCILQPAWFVVSPEWMKKISKLHSEQKDSQVLESHCLKFSASDFFFPATHFYDAARVIFEFTLWFWKPHCSSTFFSLLKSLCVAVMMKTPDKSQPTNSLNIPQIYEPLLALFPQAVKV